MAPDAAGGNNGEEYFDASATNEAATMNDCKLIDLETALDSPSQILFLKELSYMRESALQLYRTAVATNFISKYEATMQANGKFVQRAIEAVCEGATDWDNSGERAFLQAVMNNIAKANCKALTAQAYAVVQQQMTTQFLQSQQ